MTLPSTRLALLALISGLTVTLAPARGDIVGGGGSPSTDCLLVFDIAANTPAERPRHIRCADGDPCDLDGEVNGSCQFAVAVCANSTADPRCTLNGVESITVDHAVDDGLDRRFDTEFQALQSRISNTIEPPTTDPDRCTAATNFHVPVQGPLTNGGCKKGRKTVRIDTLSSAVAGKVYKDKDKLKLTCDPALAGCDPRAFYDGTFDRIQRQIFNQSCAKSTCHDSQTQAGGMILETGASYGNLVNHDPSNPGVPSDWMRVLPGDSSRSYLYHKLAAVSANWYGSRMPQDGPPYLDQHLIDIIQLWIDAGAPDVGWVDGTDD